MNPSIEESAQILRDISKNPFISQREIAFKNRVSLGKVNYSIKSLIDKGYVRVRTIAGFPNSQRRKFAYILTPEGMYEKTKRSSEFLKWMMQEYERIKREIEELEEDINGRKRNRRDAGALSARKKTGKNGAR